MSRFHRRQRRPDAKPSQKTNPNSIQKTSDSTSQARATQQRSDSSQFDTDRTYTGRWTITFSNPPINMFVPATIVEWGALMADLEADPSVKVVVF